MVVFDVFTQDEMDSYRKYNDDRLDREGDVG